MSMTMRPLFHQTEYRAAVSEDEVPGSTILTLEAVDGDLSRDTAGLISPLPVETLVTPSKSRAVFVSLRAMDFRQLERWY